MNILDQIEALENKERNSVAKYSPLILPEQINSPERLTDVSQAVFKINEIGKPDEMKRWGIWYSPSYGKPGISILWQLSLQAHLIVDISPMGLEKFVNTYGVTPNQMAKLAKAGLVTLNLYEWESDKRSNESDPFQKHHQEDNARVLEELFCDTLTSDSNYSHWRINSIRRERLFDVVLGSSKYKEAVDKAKDLFSLALTKLSKTADLSKFTRSSDVPGALTKVSNNWAYVRAFGKTDPEISEWIEFVEASLQGSIDSHETEEILRDLIGYKSWLASPYTAAFGGTHILAGRELDVVSEARYPIPKQPSQYHLTEDKKGFIEFFGKTGFERIFESTYSDEMIFVPDASRNDAVVQYIEFLEYNRERLERADEKLEEMRAAGRTRGTYLKAAEDYFQLIEGLRAEHLRLQLWQIAAEVGIATTLKEVGQIFLGLSPEMGWKLFSIGFGSAFVSSLTPFGKRFLERFLSTHNRRILDWYDGLQAPPKRR